MKKLWELIKLFIDSIGKELYILEYECEIDGNRSYNQELFTEFIDFYLRYLNIKNCDYCNRIVVIYR